MLMHLFERIHFFLERLKSYVGIPLIHEFIGLLGKIMAQLLSILALSTKSMTEGRISEFLYDVTGIETFLKRLFGRTEVEDALSRLDMLTKEEGLIILDDTHIVDNAVQDVNGNVKVTKALNEDLDDKIGVTKELVREVPPCTPHFMGDTLTPYVYYLTAGPTRIRRVNRNGEHLCVQHMMAVIWRLCYTAVAGAWSTRGRG